MKRHCNQSDCHYHYGKMMTMLEDPNIRGSEMKANDTVGNKTQEDQNQRRSVMTGFHDDTTEQEVQDILEETIATIGMSTDQIEIQCPAKPVTHAFLQFTKSDKDISLSDQRTY